MIFLTFDTDHMSNDLLGRLLDNCRIEGSGTFFCTEPYSCLEGTDHEIAPHPDLARAPDIEQEIIKYRNMFPDAVSWRSHSLHFSQVINVALNRYGYKVVSVVEQFLDEKPKPYRLPWGLLQCPIYYMDNSDFCNFNGMHGSLHEPFHRSIIDRALLGNSIFVFDFHPIHLALNTPSYEFYSRHRDAYKNGEDSGAVPFDGYGARSFFDDLNSAMASSNVKSKSLCELIQCSRNEEENFCV